MPIIWTKATQIMYRSVPAVLGAWLALVSLPVLSLEISTPKGIQEIGQTLHLKSTVSNLPEGVETQLRSTCLKARTSPFEGIRGNHETQSSREVLVSFEPTIRRGGLLEFKSVAPVNDAVVEMELVSECPLLVFRTTWTLILRQGADDHNALPDLNEVGSVSAFDPRMSALLASSRKPPQPKVESNPAWWHQDEEFPSHMKQEGLDVANSAPITQTEPVSSHDEALKVASLDTGLLGAGLIESRKESGDTSGGLGMVEYSSENAVHHLQQDLLLPVALGSLALLTMTLLFYWRHSRKKTAAVPWQTAQVHNVDQAVISEPQDVAAISREHVMTFSTEPSAMSISSHRVLESLIGNDDKNFDEELQASVRDAHTDDHNPAYRPSLKVSLELINRADIPSWTLPASYLRLVESRNRSLEMHRTLDALLLRSQIGLIELAFQDAKQGQLTPAQATQELLEQVLGDRLRDTEFKPILCVPDVVKSHVRAKMCEIAGAEKRQILRDNLVNLNTQVVNVSLCFNSNAWREFLSEEGILD